MSKFLYGASVQGIQSFIFQTNKLRDIVGASELVEQICTTKFAEIIGKTPDSLINDRNAIVKAAGNIKYIFDSKEQCENVVRIFPREICSFAPGITISQAVVEMNGNYLDFKNAVNELERRLKVQRNKPMRNNLIGLMSIRRSRHTGLPIVDNQSDAATVAKNSVETKFTLCNKAFGRNIPYSSFPFNIEDITKHNDWIAIIHADGNGLGQIVQKVGTDAKALRDFSSQLDTATQRAAQRAYRDILPLIDPAKIPIRPIVLGGDDLTVICRADIALPYTEAFLRYFQQETKERLSNQLQQTFYGTATEGLTACAGIAFIKSSFPFYFGYDLAEQLCTAAKTDAKYSEAIKQGLELPNSCIMFHKVQDSFVESYEDIILRELTPNDNVSFQFGPYYLTTPQRADNVIRWTISELRQFSEKLETKEGNAIKSHLRQWMTHLNNNPSFAQQYLDRTIEIVNDKTLVRNLTKARRNAGEQQNYYPTYDVLTIHTINNQVTK